MRTHASDSVSFTICRVEGGGEEWRRTIVGNNEVLAVNEDYDKKKKSWQLAWKLFIQVDCSPPDHFFHVQTQVTCLKMSSSTMGLLKLSLG